MTRTSTVSDASVPGDGDGDLHGALLFHEAAALLNLHAQAVAVQNIRSLVPVVLDINSSSYSRWREQFLLTLGRYQLQDHVLQDQPARISPDWTRMDCVVRSWLYGTLSNDLVDIVLSKSPHGSIARTTWLAIEAQFLGNKEARTLHLDARFRTFVQGDLSITDYCKRFKRMADDLADLGEPVTDRMLVLNVLRRLRRLQDRFHRACQNVLSVKTHRREATGNTKSREAAGALAATGPSVNGPDPGTRRRFRRCRAWHLTYTRSGRCERAFDDLPACTNTCKH